MPNHLNIANIKTPDQLGLAVRRLRKHIGLSQGELSKLINMRQPTISDIENGRGTLDSLFRIIQALEINLSLNSQATSEIETKSSKISDMLDLLKD
jgi:transcriptional regulator with XRE-family HTH domain